MQFVLQELPFSSLFLSFYTSLGEGFFFVSIFNCKDLFPVLPFTRPSGNFPT